jgi:predicted ATPase
MCRCVVISGCSGGGKSTLLTELGRRGYTVIEEPGRRIVKAECLNHGKVLPWIDPVAFLHRAMAMALADRASIGNTDDWVFFDRSLVDAAAGLQHLTSEQMLATIGQHHRYHHRVFLTPPWPEIYIQDKERRHSLDSAMAEYSRLLSAYPSLGYDLAIVPKVGVRERADFVLDTLDKA